MSRKYEFHEIKEVFNQNIYNRCFEKVIEVKRDLDTSFFKPFLIEKVEWSHNNLDILMTVHYVNNKGEYEANYLVLNIEEEKK